MRRNLHEARSLRRNYSCQLYRCFRPARTAHATSHSEGILTIVGMPPDARSLVSGKEVVVLYGNKFRYDLDAQTTQAAIGAATPPGALALSASQIAKLPAEIVPAAKSLAEASGTTSIPNYPQACDQSDPAWPSSVPDLWKVAAMVGIRALWPFLDPESMKVFTQAPLEQKNTFIVFDVLLSAALMAGGANGIHSVIIAFTSFFDASAQKSQAAVN